MQITVVWAVKRIIVWTIIQITGKSTGNLGNWNQDTMQTGEKMDGEY